jgi:hypothetical protein
MPSAQVNFISGNWVNNLTLKQQEDCYNQIVDYFTNEVIKEVFEKYNKTVDFNTELV